MQKDSIYSEMNTLTTKEEKTTTDFECKFCSLVLEHRFIDVVWPLSHTQEVNNGSFRIIHTYVCQQCFLIQMGGSSWTSTRDQVYVSSFSPTWFSTIKENTQQMFQRIEFTDQGFVAELTNHEISPGESPESETTGFGKRNMYALIEMYGRADFLACHNQLAYSHDINDFLDGIKLFLSPMGTATMEFFHLLPLMEGAEFKPSNPEAFTYFSFTTVDKILRHHRLVIFDIEECFPTGCIRIYAKHEENVSRRISTNAPILRGRERDSGMSSLKHYIDFKDESNTHGKVFRKEDHG